jgi:hypothetical protein
MKQQGRSAALVALFAFSATACYGYRTVPAASPGMDVRARLTAEAAVRRSQGLDEPVMRLSGTVLEASSSALSLDVLVARSSSAFQDVVIRDTVRLDMSEIQSLQARRFSVARTVLFTVGTGVAAFALVKGIDQIVGGTDEPPGDGTPTASVSPLISWRTVRGLLGALR